MNKYYLVKNLHGEYLTNGGEWRSSALYGKRFLDSPGKDELQQPLKEFDCIIETVYTVNRYE